MKNLITSLKPNEVFVFGSNFSAFHGAGAAGYAQRGDSKNTWRTDKKFQEALVEYNKRNKNISVVIIFPDGTLKTFKKVVDNTNTSATLLPI